MKKYLYEIDEICSNGDRWHFQGVPFMPRVLAEKTAKQMRKDWQRQGYKARYGVSKTHIRTNDGTPHGYGDWFEYMKGEQK